MLRLISASAALALLLLPEYVQAGGACCAGVRGDPGKFSVTVAGAYASSHEALGGTRHTLRQQALLLSAGIPITHAFSLQALAGLPTETELSRKGRKLEGNGGVIFGVGLGYSLPAFPGLDFHASAGYSGSSSELDTDGGTAVDMRVMISELYGRLTAETSLGTGARIYVGLKAYSGRTKLHGQPHLMNETGDREGSLAGSAGLRHSLSERINLVLDGVIGHTNVLSAGASYNF